MEFSFNICGISNDLDQEIKSKIDFLTKPPGSLGRLEEIALRVCRIQNTLEPELNKPTIVVCAGDHGAAKEGISPFPQEVTYQMVLNFLNSGAGINVFGKQHGIEVKVVDAGVNYDFTDVPGLLNKKIDYGTKSYLTDPAMTKEQCMQALSSGSEIVNDLYSQGCNVIGFGEMGIGNTSSAAIILSKISGIPLEECAGRGAGLTDEGLNKKIGLLNKAIKAHPGIESSLEVLQYFGGFEIAMMVGGMLQAAENKMIILIDGFIATSALLVAHSLYPKILDYTFFCHNSKEHGHKKMLEFLNAEPLLDLELRLGEGTGAAIAYPIIKSSVCMINEMATFKSANISEKAE